MYFDDFLNKLKAQPLPGLILFFGDSESTVWEGWQTVKASFRSKHKDGTIDSFDGSQDELSTVLDQARTTGLFSTARLIVLHHAEKTFGGQSEKAVKALKDYFSEPTPDTCLVFLAPGMRKTVKAVEAMERLGWTVQCSDMPDWKLPGWVRKKAEESGFKLSEESAQILIAKVGNEMGYLSRALEQLGLSIWPRQEAKPQDVQDLAAPGLESGIFSFLDAVASKQTEQALTLLSTLEDGVDAGTIVLLYQRMRELLSVVALKQEGLGASEITAKLGLHPFRAKNLIEQAAQFKLDELKTAVKDLIHLQAGVVTGRLGKGVQAVWLEDWLLKRRGDHRMAGAIR